MTLDIAARVGQIQVGYLALNDECAHRETIRIEIGEVTDGIEITRTAQRHGGAR